ncbi:Hemolysin C [Rhodobacteraceae bacterium THAF1]|uniref:CBS domain-containing protein n=1 Tax=Palleronia sp. THAF1 TaxID=2587842 RepID=UPI000F3C8A19|nr:CBS domain-containing protein [Palleronia sp. THAF1]QFU09469.1 Hemolysin C [Palleronia sp. THAF1]VDC21852.1 Hemolysin C [Rhodobacteraceae bacterium THAF1]
MSHQDGGSGPENGTGEDEGDSPERGFFGRIFEAFSNGEEADDATEEQSFQRTPPGLLNLSRMRVEDVAIPSVEITAVPLDISIDDLVETFRDTGVTRIPVYDGTLDHPKGMVHLKDFTLKHGFGNEQDFDLTAMMRPLIYAPPSMPIGVLLQRMQSERTHMALVIDEYGGVDGLVTIEDLIEQVIGQIEDEHDEDEDKLFSEEKPGIWIAQARTPLNAFEEAVEMGLSDPEEEEEIDTLGGLIVVHTGRVPARGEVIPHPSGAEFEVVDADPRRLKRLRVRLPGHDQA